MTPSLGGYAFVWPDLPYLVTLSRIRENSRGTTGELCAQYHNGTGKPLTLLVQTVNLLTSKSRLAKELDTKHPAPWVGMLDQVCLLTLRALRQGEPIESLAPTETDAPAWFVLNPLLYEKNTTVLYGPGDSLKSMLALYCGCLLASGMSGPDLSVAPTPWKVLYLDWEMSVKDVRGRIKLLQAGDPRLSGLPDYRRCSLPLADEADALKKVLDEGGYDVLILDSLAMAAGGQELERADAALRFNAALRGLNCTSLVIGHTPKPQEDQPTRSLYGSVFFFNLCRVAWEVRREGNTIGLYQRKNNLGRVHDPIGLAFDTTDESCLVHPADLFDTPELESSLKLQDRIAGALRDQPGQTPKELALALGVKADSVKAKLYLYKKRFVQLDGKWECLA